MTVSADKPSLQWVNTTKQFGGVKALTDFSLRVSVGEVHGLIGPNGAGKSTAVNIATGAYRLDAGQILLQGRDVSRASTAARARMGLGRTFQHPHPFESLTVWENLEISTRKARDTSGSMAVDTHGLLEVLGLDADKHTLMEELPYGRQKLVGIVQAFLWGRGAILLDEPMAGLTSHERLAVSDLLRQRHLVGILLIEHDVETVMSICDQITVMVSGSVIACGDPAAIRADESVSSAYLGSPITASGLTEAQQ